MSKRIRSVAAWLAAHEFYVVALCALASIVTAQVQILALIVIGFFLLVRWFVYGRLHSCTPADWPIALVAIMGLITLLVTITPEKTFTQVQRLFIGIGFYYSIVNWADSIRRVRLLMLGLIAVGVAIALTAPFSVTWQKGVDFPFLPVSILQRFPLLFTDTVNPNVMAGNLIMLLPLAMSLILFNWHALSLIERCIVLVASFLIISILLLTQSRGGLLSLVIVVMLLISMRWKKGGRLMLVIGAGGFGVISIVGPSVILNGLTTNTTFEGLGDRLVVWSRTVLLIQDFPLTGIGMGSFQDIINILYPFPTQAWVIPHAHNLFLQIALDLGLPGLVAWLAILLLVFTMAWQSYRQGALKNPMLRGVGVALICSQAALILHGLTDAVTWGMVRPAILVWAIWGMAVANWKIVVFADEAF